MITPMVRIIRTRIRESVEQMAPLPFSLNRWKPLTLYLITKIQDLVRQDLVGLDPSSVRLTGNLDASKEEPKRHASPPSSSTSSSVPSRSSFRYSSRRMFREIRDTRRKDVDDDNDVEFLIFPVSPSPRPSFLSRPVLLYPSYSPPRFSVLLLLYAGKPPLNSLGH